MKQLSKVFLTLAMLFSFAASNAQTGYGVGIGNTEPIDSLELYDFVPAAYGKPFPYLADSLLVAPAVVAKDKSGSTAVCDSIPEDLTGKIVFVDRGAPVGAPAGTVCFLLDKVYYAWKKGAKAVIIINNSANAPIYMGAGTDPKGALINIPVAMISKAQGDKIKAKIAANAVYTMGLIRPNDNLNDAYPITSGEWISPEMEAGSGAIGDTTATNANWYTFSAPKSGKMDISSCGKGVNTSLFVYALSGNNIIPVASNLSACPKNAADTNKQAAELKGISVAKGGLYFIEWNDLASADSFNFVLNFVKADSVNLTVKVDMKNETVDAAGVHVAGSFQGWDPAKTKCTNIAGTTIWTKTIRVKSDSDYEYKFVNGNAWGKDESVVGACSKGANGNRAVTVATENIDLAAACFKSCDACVNPPLVCDKDAILCDDFEKYALGPLGKNKSSNWSVWDGNYTAAGPINITAENSTSSKQAGLIDGAATLGQDAVLKLGNRKTGTYTLKWKMFVPTGKCAYFNIQHDTTYGAANHVFANEVYFARNGTARMFVGANPAVSFNYPKDKWFDVVQNINIEKDSSFLTIGTAKTMAWKWSIASKNGATTTNSQLQGVNFYADSTFAKYYIDDVQLIQPKRAVTFTVDMKGQTVDAEGVYIAGDFQKVAGYAADWDPKLTKLTKGTGTEYSITVNIPDGVYEYKYVNGNAWGKDESVSTCSPKANGNRGVTVAKDMSIPVVCFKKCYSCDLSAVTFSVDMSNEKTISADGISIAGSFQKAIGGAGDWAPGLIFLKDNGKKVYSTTLVMPAGSYEYKFLNGKAWGTDETVKGACAAANGNRKITVAVGTDAKIDTSCFRYCVSCKVSISTNDAAFDAALNVFPNPAQNEVTLNYNFSEATNINVSVLNTLGQVMYSEKISGADAGAAVLDVKNFTDGVYMIQVTDDKNRQSVKRLVIQK